MDSSDSSARKLTLPAALSSYFAFQDITLELECGSAEIDVELSRVLHDLSWSKTVATSKRPLLTLRARAGSSDIGVPVTARRVVDADGWLGLEDGDDFYLTDGESLLLLQPVRSSARAQIAPEFFEKPAHIRRSFWTFAILKLLRWQRLYSLHAAGLLVAGLGLLVVGRSGCGKSTLTLGLIRCGAKYLSDDALFLRARSGDIEMLPLRKHLFVDEADTRRQRDFHLAERSLDSTGKARRRIDIDKTHADRGVSTCTPRLLLFPRIVASSRSRILPIEPAKALKVLIEQSGPQLFDRQTLPGQLAMLRSLLLQARPFELAAGRDVLDDPDALVRLLNSVSTEVPCLVSSSS